MRVKDNPDIVGGVPTRDEELIVFLGELAGYRGRDHVHTRVIEGAANKS